MKKGNIVLFYPSYEDIGKYNWFPFPYLYIGPFLEKAGFQVKVVDARVEPGWKRLLEKSLADAICLGITSTTSPDIKDSLEAARIAKRVNSKLTVVWGGPHATAQPEQTVKLENVDIVVRGQGEYIMTEIVNRIYVGKDFSDIPSITFKRAGLIHNNKGRDLINIDYDIFPAFHLIDIEKYRSPNNVVSIFTARGCPFQCSFCVTNSQGYSLRSFEQAKKEVSFAVNDLKFKNIVFQDGTFFVKKDRVMQIANWLFTSGLNIKWKAKARSNSLLDYSEADFTLLKKAGLTSIFYGLESGSERILKNMRKNTKPEHAERNAQICKTYNFEFYTSFLFATPYDTIKDLKLTIKHIKKLRKINPDIIVQNCIYLPLPGTPMYEDACKCGFLPPATIEGWTVRGIALGLNERPDITWIPENILKEYMKIYNDEFSGYKHVYKREEEGSYVSVFKKPSN